MLDAKPLTTYYFLHSTLWLICYTVKMRITKFVHSCLLVEHDGLSVLIDPGVYSWPRIELDKLPDLDVLLISHVHTDHYCLEAVRGLRERFSGLPIVTNSEVEALLERGKVELHTQVFSWCETSDMGHPPVPWKDDDCLNTAFHLFDQLTFAGDSLELSETRPILALPITATWGSTAAAVELAVKLRPQIVIPIHDWHWHDAARTKVYSDVESVLTKHNIRFQPLNTGIPKEITL